MNRPLPPVPRTLLRNEESSDSTRLLWGYSTSQAHTGPHSQECGKDAPFSSRNQERTPLPSRYIRSWTAYLVFSGLFLTTLLSFVLLVSCARKWTLSSSMYAIVINNRASVQLALQLVANALGVMQVSVVLALINYATRIYFGKHPVRLYMLQLWHGLCTRSVQWRYPVKLLVPIIVFILITATPSALWAGALTPVVARATYSSTIDVPQYVDTTHLTEYPSEINEVGPVLRSKKGFFTFSVGVQMQGSLLASASSATPVDGGVRQHQKMDYSSFTYLGRSYGLGSSIGLVDDAFADSDINLSYSYQEVGFDTKVTCIYNHSADYMIASDIGDQLWSATGMLPNSGSAGPEYSVYVGHDTSAIVAIGVGRQWTNPRRMLGIAAGDSYRHLDKTQCEMSFDLKRFNISVGLSARNITISPLNDTDVESPLTSANLTHVLMRQFELIANDQTNLYVSLVGNSLNASISDYIIAYNGSAPLSLENATLPGLENAFTAMLDDMLVAYASAQLLIAKQYVSTTVVVTAATLRVGENAYIYSVFVVNTLVVAFVVLEAIRTRGWRKLIVLDFLDPADLLVAGARGAEDRGNKFNANTKAGSSEKATVTRDLAIILNDFRNPYELVHGVSAARRS